MIGTFRNWPRSDQQPVITNGNNICVSIGDLAHSVSHCALRSLPPKSTTFIYIIYLQFYHPTITW